MGLLDGLLGGTLGAGIVTVLNSYVEKHGGLQGVVSQFEQQGMGDTIKSWIGNGENQPISPGQVHQVIGADTLRELAAKVGMTPEDLAAKLSTLLPTAVDKMTPNGTIG
jgi:uncharacterized protein YidB (DUF937 family)